LLKALDCLLLIKLANKGDPDWIEFFLPKFWKPLDCKMLSYWHNGFLFIDIFEIGGFEFIPPGVDEYWELSPFQLELGVDKG
jgi:hypothetical protein